MCCSFWYSLTCRAPIRCCLPINAGGNMQHCEHCNHDARLLDGVSKLATVDYYRCPVCGEVWTAPKDGDQSDSPEESSTDYQNSAF